MTIETEIDPEFENLLNHLWRSRGFDFSGYKRTSLMRRVRKRMSEVKIEEFIDYTDYLEVHPDEFVHLFDTILINVTAFFRDLSAWEYLKDHIIPKIIEKKTEGEPIRVWSAACASGEEAYSLAILFAEALGIKEFRQRVKIYATDADENSLNTARQANYSLRSIENIPVEYRDKYFVKDADNYIFQPNLRKSIIFGRHDLVQDPPISRVDLLVCRNTLMYFNSETQNKILNRFNFALSESGFLFLGKAEMLLSHTDSFAQADLKQRVFIKTQKAYSIEKLLPMQPPHFETFSEDSKSQKLTEASMDSSLVSQLLIDHTGTLIVANKNARALFNLKHQDIGKALQDLEISYRPVELRSLIEQAYSERQPVKVPKIERLLPNKKTQFLELEVTPLFIKDGYPLGVTISFVDITNFFTLRLELEAANQELETANEELQSAHEELETTNEELQSTNEELETTNEELQSTNEELETMNEELRSTNEELEAMNGDLKTVSDELNHSNAFLESILSSMTSVVVATNANFEIIAWNYRAQDLWGLSAKEAVGCSLWEIDTGLPVDLLKKPLNDFKVGTESMITINVDGTSRRGKPVSTAIKVTRLSRLNGQGDGYLLMMDSQTL